MKQQIIFGSNREKELDVYLQHKKCKKVFIVCGSSMKYLSIYEYFQSLEKRLGISTIYFSDFSPNPQYQSVLKGIALFRQEACDAIIGVGGGSAIDVAKCIKMFVTLSENKSYLEQHIIPNNLPFVALPTTAGTGSEATKFAVIYNQGEKVSVSDESCIPEFVWLNHICLRNLPLYQRKCTMMDALCHAMEAYWSVNSTEESKLYSKEAITIIIKYKEEYLNNSDLGNENMLKAANMAGKAINIAKTTAAHAMSYKLTGLYNISHGHAVALCIPSVWRFMLQHLNMCNDDRGQEYLTKMFDELAHIMKKNSAMEAVEYFQQIVDDLKLEIPIPDENEYDILTKTVNIQRLKNTPVSMSESQINEIYHDVLKRRGGE